MYIPDKRLSETQAGKVYAICNPFLVSHSWCFWVNLRVVARRVGTPTARGPASSTQGIWKKSSPIYWFTLWCTWDASFDSWWLTMISLALFTIYHDLPWFTSSPPVQLKVPFVRPETLRCGVTSEADAADARAWVPSCRSICCLAKRTLETTWDPNTSWRCSWGYSSVWL